MKGYVFTYGVDGFGADIAPAHEEGVYLNYSKAFARLCELNKDKIDDGEFPVYEKGYGEDFYPEDNKILAKAEAEEDWKTFNAELDKHIIKDVKKVCEAVVRSGYPPIGWYCIEEIDIFE